MKVAISLPGLELNQPSLLLFLPLLQLPLPPPLLPLFSFLFLPSPLPSLPPLASPPLTPSSSNGKPWALGSVLTSPFPALCISSAPPTLNFLRFICNESGDFRGKLYVPIPLIVTQTLPFLTELLQRVSGGNYLHLLCSKMRQITQQYFFGWYKTVSFQKRRACPLSRPGFWTRLWLTLTLSLYVYSSGQSVFQPFSFKCNIWVCKLDHRVGSTGQCGSRETTSQDFSKLHPYIRNIFRGL